VITVIFRFFIFQVRLLLLFIIVSRLEQSDDYQSSDINNYFSIRNSLFRYRCSVFQTLLFVVVVLTSPVRVLSTGIYYYYYCCLLLSLFRSCFSFYVERETDRQKKTNKQKYVSMVIWTLVASSDWISWRAVNTFRGNYFPHNISLTSQLFET